MQSFVMLTRIAPEAMRSPKSLEELERTAMDRIRTICPQIKWIANYAVLGPYDYLDVFEAPDVETATKVAALIRTFGHATTEIWAATPWDRFKKVIHDLPGAPERRS
jgi:uncharacterized protein with GYD domain